MNRALLLAPLQVVQALVGLGAIAAFTRLMSAEDFGRYALALSVFMFAHTLVFTWAEAAAFRFFASARAEHRLADHYATLIGLALALGAAALLLTAGLLTLAGLQRDALTLCMFAAGSAIARFLLRLGRESERAGAEVGRYAIFETGYLVLGFGFGVALLTRTDLGAAAPFAGLLLAGVVVLFVDAPHFLARGAGGSASIARAASYASYGAPLALALAVDLGVQTLSRFILAHQAGPAALGAYAAAFGLARPLDLIFIGAGAALATQMLAVYEQHGADAARAIARAGFEAIAAIAAPAAIGLALVARPLASLMVGATLSTDAAALLPWLALAGLAQGFSVYYWSEAFQLTRRTGQRAALMLIPGFVQITLTGTLAFAFGAEGAAMAAAAGAIASALVLAIVGRTLLALPIPFAALTRIGAASAAMTLGVLALPPAQGIAGLALAVSVGAFIYGASALALDLAGVRAKTTALIERLMRLTPTTERADAAS